eukprot:1161754-Pelagomonas_calceolata.AAC.3
MAPHLIKLLQYVTVPGKRVRPRVGNATHEPAHLVIHIRQPLQEALYFSCFGLRKLQGQAASGQHANMLGYRIQAGSWMQGDPSISAALVCASCSAMGSSVEEN